MKIRVQNTLTKKSDRYDRFIVRKIDSMSNLSKWLLVAIPLAAVYYGSGKIGIAIALPIPPGNITALWPPSGIAWAANLCFGYRF